jgi:hypothetical protein
LLLCRGTPKGSKDREEESRVNLQHVPLGTPTDYTRIEAS